MYKALICVSVLLHLTSLTIAMVFSLGNIQDILREERLTPEQ